MDVILREDVDNLGTTGEVVRVKPGFARNYLLPRGMAVIADPRNRNELEHRKRMAEEKRERDQRKAAGLAQKIAADKIVIEARAGEEGKLFGSVTNQDIERAMSEAGHSIDRRRIKLDEPIKALGEYHVSIQLMAGVVGEINVSVVPVGGDEPAPEAPSGGGEEAADKAAGE